MESFRGAVLYVGDHLVPLGLCEKLEPTVVLVEHLSAVFERNGVDESVLSL